MKKNIEFQEISSELVKIAKSLEGMRLASDWEEWQVENFIRDSLSGTSRSTKESLMYKAAQRVFQGISRRDFSRIWNELVSEGYLVETRSGNFVWEI